MNKDRIMTRLDLWRAGIRVYVNGVERNIFDDTMPKDGDEIKVYHICQKKPRRSGFLHPCVSTKRHPKGLNKIMQYLLVNFHANHLNVNMSMSLHRLLYIWFYDDVKPNMDIGHLDGDSFNNNLSNLKQMTRQENLAMRMGAINQYGKRIKDR